LRSTSSSKLFKGLEPAEYDRIQAPALGIFNKITPQYRLPYYWYLDPATQEEFNRNIESLAKWIEGTIQRFRSGVKNSLVIEVHNTCHYVFIVDEALVVRERASSCLMNEGACVWINWFVWAAGRNMLVELRNNRLGLICA
jgi:hypothetical protein